MPRLRAGFQALRAKSFLVVPLLARDRVLGLLVADNQYSRAPLVPEGLHLLPTFALHIATAVDCAGLLTEVQTRDDALSEAREHEAATSAILRAMSSSPADLQAVLDAVAESSARLCEANDAVVFRVDGDVLHAAAHYGSIPTSAVEEPVPIRQDVVTGRVILERRVFHVADVLAEPDSEFAGSKAYAARFGYRTYLGVPMLREGKAIGVIGMRRAEVRPFSEKQIALLETFADQAVIAIENTRLFNELESRNRDLSKLLEQQTATSEILRVISSSPTDVQPVFDAIARSALRLIGGHSAGVARRADDTLHLAAITATNEAGDEALRKMFPAKLTGQGVLGKAVLSGLPAYVSDFETDPAYSPAFRETVRLRGYRALLAVPMMRDGGAVGGITVTRRDPGPFTDHQINLLKTFADQAVIAIENTRLFKELQARNRDLTESLEQQTATSEILRVISQSQRDVQPVFETIVANALKLCGASRGALFTYDGNLVRIGAVS
ncbi:MAG: GAF domain-containing protein, partial [Burkholderiales bacterium]